MRPKYFYAHCSGYVCSIASDVMQTTGVCFFFTADGPVDASRAAAAIARDFLPGAWINHVVIDQMDEHGNPLPAVAIVPTPPRHKRTLKTKPQLQPQLQLL